MLNLARAIDEMPQVDADALSRIDADPADVETPERIIDALWDGYCAAAGTTDRVRLRSLYEWELDRKIERTGLVDRGHPHRPHNAGQSIPSGAFSDTLD